MEKSAVVTSRGTIRTRRPPPYGRDARTVEWGGEDSIPIGASVRSVTADCIEDGRRERDAVKGARKMTGLPRS